MKTYLDIETLPSEDEYTLVTLRENAKAPANFKDPEKIKAAKELDFDKAWRKTALNGTYGTIACICWAVEAGEIRTVEVSTERDEHNAIETFFTLLNEQLTRTSPPWFIGHNVGFDLRFLWRRAVIHNIRPPFKLPYNAAAWGNKYSCTMFEWCGAKEFIKLKELCRVLGIDCDGDIDGSDVYDEWKSGNHEKVIAHCRADVTRVRQIYGRLLVA